MPNIIISGIYTIQNLLDNKFYVGFAIDVYDRFSTHLSDLRKGKHKNSHLQKAFNKYGEESFVFELLVECSIDLLASEEHYWATLLNVHNPKFGYNIRPTHPNGKSINNEYIRKKISDSNKGRKISLETIKKIIETRRKNGNFVLSEEHKRKIGNSNKGKGLGKKLSLSTRLKMSNSFKGRKMSDHFKENLRIKNTGKKYSKETKKKMSLSKIGKRMKCHHIPVILLDNINREFECITDLSKYLNCSTTQISRVISGKQKKVCGFKVIKKI